MDIDESTGLWILYMGDSMENGEFSGYKYTLFAIRMENQNIMRFKPFFDFPICLKIKKGTRTCTVELINEKSNFIRISFCLKINGTCIREDSRILNSYDKIGIHTNCDQEPREKLFIYLQIKQHFI